MNTEYEVRVLEVNKEELIKKLEELKCVFMFDRLQKRYTYDFNPIEANRWIRLRTNGLKSTLTIKDITSSGIDGTKEIEIVVSDFDKTNEILENLGYKHRNYQENRRCQYSYNDIEIDIDDWPLIPTYMEIEGPNSEKVLEMLELLEIDRNKATTKDVTTIYNDYGIDILKIKQLKLEEERL